ncbi:hypothetical protein [Streptomyces sp. A244]|uniref:hypothetical protein n=1 Tax=Streptomyces sp. A244 TaxID=2137016 RepID=UPI0011B2324E|nr:hypothetical protein [Streptomyces sp. A244]
MGAGVFLPARALLLLMGMLFSLVIALIAVIMVRSTGVSTVNAIFKGGTAFTASMLIWIAAMAL